ncbi:MAG: hypothetical protein AB1696_27830 [Planctomycetota bacterium]
MLVNKKDRDVLRELARQVAEIASLPCQQQTISLWKALNGLKPVRPMVMIDQIPWHEMDVDGELTLRTEDAFCQGLETRLRRTLYSWKHMRADMVVEPIVDVPKVIRGAGFGIQTIEKRAVSDPKNSVVGHYYIDQLKSDADVEKIRKPEIALDEEATARVQEKAQEIFDGILTVRMQGSLPGFAPWDRIVQWRGAESVLFDLADRPEFIHRIMARLTDAHISMLDQLEEKGLLGHGQATIHCTGAYSDDLPAPGFDPSHVRAKDLWTCGMAQIFSTVSPAMHQEFELDYAVRWYSRFGLVYYGCCEPLDGKIHIIRNIPHVRKISMSPWVDVEKGAERIGRDFVFSRKPSPALLAGDAWRPEAVEADLRDTKERCARHGCPLEFILKDISTVRYQPQRLWEWAKIAKTVVEG